MTRDNETHEMFDEISRRITAAEKDLRRRFEDTPRPSQEVLMRIKARLLAEMQHVPAIRHSRVRWVGWGAAFAAAVLVIAAAGLYYRFRVGNGAATGPGVAEPTASSLEAKLDTFASTLPSALGDEDAALRQLSRDLNELETQTAKSWDDTRQPNGPTARQSGEPLYVASLAAGEYGRAHDQPSQPPVGDWRNV